MLEVLVMVGGEMLVGEGGEMLEVVVMEVGEGKC